MSGNPFVRTVAIGASAVLLLAALGAPVVAANRPKCMGHDATIVGTNKADVLKGTARRDVIVAKGGNDIIVGRGGNDVICAGAGNDKVAGQAGNDRIAGQLGKDRLFGGGGVDRLFGGLHDDLLAGGAGPDVLGGQGGNDRLDGGIGIDLCQQGTGSGAQTRCELPFPLIPTPVPRTIAIAYSNLDDNPGYGPKDKLIAKLVDVDGNGVDAGDQIVMGYYPLHYWPGPADFEPWRELSHTVAHVVADERPFTISVRSTDATYHYWGSASTHDIFSEAGEGTNISSAQDSLAGGGQDMLLVRPSSPSRPALHIDDYVDPPAATGDAPFLDVEIYQ